MSGSGSGKPAIADLFGLKGKVALVTGGNGGIGKAIAKGLAAAGADVVIAARDEAKTNAATAELARDFGVTVVGMKLDVLDESSVLAVLAQVKDRFGRLDILVNNSGMAVNKLPQNMPVEDWDLNTALGVHRLEGRLSANEGWWRRQDHQYRLHVCYFRRRPSAGLLCQQGRRGAANQEPGASMGG